MENPAAISVASARPPRFRFRSRCSSGRASRSEALALTDKALADERRWTLAATILGSSLTFIDGGVVNIALPALQVPAGLPTAPRAAVRLAIDGAFTSAFRVVTLSTAAVALLAAEAGASIGTPARR